MSDTWCRWCGDNVPARGGRPGHYCSLPCVEEDLRDALARKAGERERERIRDSRRWFLKVRARSNFGTMQPEQHREISRRGGAAVPVARRAFKDPELAARAGALGGTRTPAKARCFSDRERAMHSGRLGGLASAEMRRRLKEGVAP